MKCTQYPAIIQAKQQDTQQQLEGAMKTLQVSDLSGGLGKPFRHWFSEFAFNYPKLHLIFI